ncbi:long-chain fatty acid transporter-like protein [Mytilinidion resinicola]|uniref:Long-chain fatty acid transporter-like protein n=1 Tax=Mytilinidion resinicola TaxID=574789 RepID=A0A6A6YZR3_9PEZI|nr:long-chain fatty acid transporter-like protein [Mytilinidion resinicola]KAF2813457.1 long-chain fatty acid transporter-like protein [Mytilinidion resinicola]
MALPILAGVAGTTALAAYLNAKYHLIHDLSGSTLTPTDAEFAWLANRAASRKLTTYDIFEAQALHNVSNHIFLIFEGREFTYREFFDHVTKVGAWLMNDLGVQTEEVVALNGGNSPEFLMLWLALDGIGAVPSFINYNLTGKALVHCVKLCESRYLISDSDVQPNVEPCAPELEESGVKLLYYNSDLITSLPSSGPLPQSRRDSITLETLRGLIYTSGTTGLPKGTQMTTGRELLVGHVTARYLKLTPSIRFYTCMPLYHGAAHGLCLTPSIHAGCTVVLGRKFSHKTFWPEVSSSKADIIQYVGELCRYLYNAPPSPLERAHNVKMAWGNGMRPDVWEPFRERFNIPCINELYAATDGLGSTFNRNHGPFTQHAIGLRGLVWHWKNAKNEVRVKMDVDTEEIVRDNNGFAVKAGTNEPGQVLHKLDPALLGSAPTYYKNEGATMGRRLSDVFEKGDLWFRSGDMMRQDADGRVYFVDRLGDTFRWKSENVSTNEVADVLGQFHQIAEVNVYGVQIPRSDGRAGAACFVLAENVKESEFDYKGLAEHALARLPRYAVPIFLRLSPALEYTGTLKIQKGRLKMEGVDPEKVSGGDKLFWLPPGEESYVPFQNGDWDGLGAGRVKL